MSNLTKEQISFVKDWLKYRFLPPTSEAVENLVKEVPYDKRLLVYHNLGKSRAIDADFLDDLYALALDFNAKKEAAGIPSDDVMWDVYTLLAQENAQDIHTYLLHKEQDRLPIHAIQKLNAGPRG